MKDKLLFLIFTLLGYGLQAQTACTAAPGATVSTPSGETHISTCPGDGNPDLVEFTNTATPNASFAYAITDASQTILAITMDNQLDFEGAGFGNCFVWGFSYNGNITAQAGDNVFSTQFSDNCWYITNNAISVNRTSVDGGMVMTSQGTTTEYVCIGDGISDFIGFRTNSTAGANYRFVITDDQNNILGLPPVDFLDFSGAGTGVCRVWGLSYTGSITAQAGDNAAAVALSDGCFDLSDNFIEVVRAEVDGGTVSTPSGDNRVYTCTGDADPSVVDFTHQTSVSGDYAYAITNEQNIILEITTNNSFDFNNAPSGVCRVFGFSYSGPITAQPGDLVYTTKFSRGCWQISSNAIEVVRTFVNGGTVAMPSGATRRYTCPGDGNDDIVMFTHNNNAPGTNYAYVITDDQNNILGLPPSNSQNFEGAGTGVCRVWGLSYTGTITAQAGDNAAAVSLTDGCFELSSNFIEIIRDNPDGGTVSTATGETEVDVCASDGVDDIFEFAHQNNSMAAFRYVITDDQNTIIGVLPTGVNMQNFDGAGPGVCRVWGLSFTGQLTAQAGDNAAAVALSNDCFELSSNFVTVTRYEVDGGSVAMPSGATRRYTCPGDGNDDIVMFVHTNNASTGTNYAYVITDDQNNILGLPPGNSQNFEGAGTGVCRVWGLSYTGTITAQAGDNAAAVALTDGCFDLSDNFIEIIRDNPDGGTVSTVSGETEVEVCASDGVDDIFEFAHQNNSMAAFRYVITDDQNTIIGVLPIGVNMQNFDGAGPGVCRVWGLSFTGQLTAQAGDNAAAVALSNDCFELSSNFVTVTRYEVDGGSVAMPSGATTRYTCPGDGNDDIVMFVHTNNASTGTNYAYVITDDQNNILGLPPGNSQNFEGAGTGVCRVWGLSYTGTITAQAGDNAAAVALADGCFDLSDNFIEIIRDNPDGGTVATVDGETAIAICAGDGTDDIIQFTHQTSSNAAFRYIITDDQNIILGIPPAGVNEQNFEGAGGGVCRVWGVSYTGQLTAQAGDDAAAVALSNDCFELSSNFIEVTRNTSGGACDPFRGGGSTNALLASSSQVFDQFEAYPNPVVQELTYVFEQKVAEVQTYTVRLLDVSGKVILSEQFEGGQGVHRRQMNVDGVAKGLYFLQVNSPSGQLTKKVSKQ